jgi:hypothetical protein
MQGGETSPLDLRSVNAATGSQRWARTLPLRRDKIVFLPDLRIVDGLIYVTGVVEVLWPTVLVIDGNTGDMTMASTDQGGGDLIQVDDRGAMYATFGSYGKSALMALRPIDSGPGFLGTTTYADRWPDACRLLTSQEYQAAYPG